MTFYQWYQGVISPQVYSEQQPYERETIAFQAIEKLTREDILAIYGSMKESDLRLALFDHVKNCITEQWDPNEAQDFPDESE